MAEIEFKSTKLNNYVKLRPLKNYYLSIIMLALVTGLYYMKSFGINILSLIITLAYVLVANKDLINDIKRMIVRRIKKKA